MRSSKLFLLVSLICGTVTCGFSQSHWTQQNPTPPVSDLYSVIWTGSQFVALGKLGLIMTSPDGNEWTVRQSLQGYTLKSVLGPANKWVAVGAPPGAPGVPFPILPPPRDALPCPPPYPGAKFVLTMERAHF